VDWIQLAQVMIQWRTLLKKNRVSQQAGNYYNTRGIQLLKKDLAVLSSR